MLHGPNTVIHAVLLHSCTELLQTDSYYRTGIDHGDEIWEQGGFAVHFFSRGLVDELARGWQLDQVEAFEEGDLPRRLWLVLQTAHAAPNPAEGHTP